MHIFFLENSRDDITRFLKNFEIYPSEIYKNGLDKILRKSTIMKKLHSV